MSLELILGPMFSGKSTYALSYIRRQTSIGKTVLVIKPKIDNRYSNQEILVTHDQQHTPCMLWDTRESLNPAIPELQASNCIVIEEAQFFNGLVNFVRYAMLVYSKDIVVVGLDGDATQQPFGDILHCIPWATRVTKLCALCKRCKDGTVAPFTRRTYSNNSQQVDVGGSDKYESVCLKHLTNHVE